MSDSRDLVPSGSIGRIGVELWRLAIAPSGIAGILGIMLLMLAGGVTAYHWFHEREDEACVVGPADVTAGTSPGFAILRAEPVEWQFRKNVCVIVRNVAPEAELRKREGDVAAAEAALAKAPLEKRAAARADLAAAEDERATYQKGFDYRLYVNGRRSDLTAHAATRSGAQPLLFSVTPDEDATSSAGVFWRTVLAQPTQHGRVPIELGLAPKEAEAPAASVRETMINGQPVRLTFLLYQPVVLNLTAAGVAGLLIGFCGLGYKTSLLRQGDTNTTAYSLSRVQMAFWLVLSTCGFVYVWMVTGQYTNVFPSALFVLIGISGATAGAAQVVEKTRSAVPQSIDLFHDVAGAWVGGQVQLHRLQIIAWTLILGVIFAWNVVANLRLTSFDTNLLVLAGVANGVYVTLKAQEQN